jgi:hypothetical protein
MTALTLSSFDRDAMSPSRALREKAAFAVTRFRRV